MSFTIVVYIFELVMLITMIIALFVGLNEIRLRKKKVKKMEKSIVNEGLRILFSHKFNIVGRKDPEDDSVYIMLKGAKNSDPSLNILSINMLDLESALVEFFDIVGYILYENYPLELLPEVGAPTFDIDLSQFID